MPRSLTHFNIPGNTDGDSCTKERTRYATHNYLRELMHFVLANFLIVNRGKQIGEVNENKCIH